ncbi:MAG: hypothetical protein IJX76_00635 [Clostridia bacterium]|nr:hypothetical protein [Clostridia bacterium]
MKYILLFLGLALAFFGFSFLMKYIKLRLISVKAVGKVVDNRRMDATAKMPSGWAAVADYEAAGQRVRGIAALPMSQKYAKGYNIDLLWNKANPKSFVPVAFTRAMLLYSLLFPIGMALAIWGITMFF